MFWSIYPNAVSYTDRSFSGNSAPAPVLAGRRTDFRDVARCSRDPVPETFPVEKEASTCGSAAIYY
ncbi:TPA: hypothetical protein DDW35_13580 [Candidatus Sumerlaeota bacterium]|nr:hypothetical protein [Candidatus Sumerlaeota bacterium]